MVSQTWVCVFPRLLHTFGTVRVCAPRLLPVSHVQGNRWNGELEEHAWPSPSSVHLLWCCLMFTARLSRFTAAILIYTGNPCALIVTLDIRLHLSALVPNNCKCACSGIMTLKHISEGIKYSGLFIWGECSIIYYFSFMREMIPMWKCDRFW